METHVADLWYPILVGNEKMGKVHVCGEVAAKASKAGKVPAGLCPGCYLRGIRS